MEASGILREARPEAIVEGQHVVALGQLPPELDHLLQAVGLGGSEVVGLVEVRVEMVELPPVGIERRARRVIGDGLPALVPQSTVPELLEILRLGLRRRRRIGEARLETRAFERHLPDTVDLVRRRDADDVEQRRQDVRHMAELVAQPAARRDALRPRDHQRIADAAAVRVLLVAPEGRVRGHRPAVREVVAHLRAADVLETCEPLGPQHRPRAERDAAEQPALLAGAVVGKDEDDGVVEEARALEECDEAAKLAVGVVEHAGEGRLQPQEEAALVGGVLVPRFHAIVARRHASVRRHDAQLDLLG